MASEGGGFNPASFYIGVVDFFAIVLPGAILGILLCATSSIRDYFAWPRFHGGFPFSIPWIQPILFAIACYVVGHFLAAIGFGVMTPLFKENRSLFARDIDLLAARAKKSMAAPGLSDERLDEQLRWTLAYLSVRSPLAATRLDALEADSKFFRNLTPTVLLSLPIFDLNYLESPLIPLIELVLVVLLLFAAVVRGQWSDTQHPPGDGGLLRAIRSRVPLFVLVCSLLAVILFPIHEQLYGRHLIVDATLIALALAAGLRYMALQGKLSLAAYAFLLVSLNTPALPAVPAEAAEKPAEK